FLEALQSSSRCVMASPTKFETLMVAIGRRGDQGQGAADLLLAEYRIDIIDWTDALADVALKAFRSFGKGRHKAALNFGDCMSYALAKSLDAPLLYKGNDFALTDLRSAA
ncbi:MAG: type II toxin-antitoxin system VapC family toxin, partial [Sphingomonas bacterium]|nr:type II toxin-antitoxin system VapC family toxin [Sphingomonas bacterium]